MNDTQLLQNYSDQEKAAYLSVIASLASADREASAPEVEFLQQLAHTAGLSGGATQQVLAAAKDSSNESIKQNLDALKSSDLRFSLVTDLISFARADGAYSNDEEAMVNKISAYLGINQEQKQALETVVDQAASVPHDPNDPGKQGFLNSIGSKLDSVGIPKGALMAGLLGVVAPMVISRVMGGGRSSGGLGGMMGGSGSMGGLLGGAMGSATGGGSMGGLLGGLLGGGLLSSVLGGGGQSSGQYSDLPAQGSHVGSGGLGSLTSILGGLGGQPNSAPRSAGGGGLGSLLGGGMGSLLGGLLGR
ncbi:TerB family tellurite resistance protein [Hymenobacter sp. BT491]|uniref:TerB family tellurite resistance protein n=1 Tax=Hymenobacter sp. BT491 TaxID=2766779 RepID=UPI001653DFFA|nr:TerB family tellurite resistance protein [Hymenobacter sp. BT491]MBC6991666.1 TerB family tellurite resistance protein [Hymenobacter sp. BT491]